MYVCMVENIENKTLYNCKHNLCKLYNNSTCYTAHGTVSPFEHKCFFLFFYCFNFIFVFQKQRKKFTMEWLKKDNNWSKLCLFFWNFPCHLFECVRRVVWFSYLQECQVKNIKNISLKWNYLEKVKKRPAKLTIFPWENLYILLLKQITLPEFMSKNVPVFRIKIVFTAVSTIFNFQQPIKTRDLFSTANENP